MDQREIENWKRVKVALEEAGKTDCYFYKRAVAIANKQPDPFEKESPFGK
jgi:hypothetical protein